MGRDAKEDVISNNFENSYANIASQPENYEKKKQYNHRRHQQREAQSLLQRGFEQQLNGQNQTRRPESTIQQLTSVTVTAEVHEQVTASVSSQSEQESSNQK